MNICCKVFLPPPVYIYIHNGVLCMNWKHTRKQNKLSINILTDGKDIELGDR